MSEFEDRLNNLLNNPDEMSKLSQMAQSLMEGGALENLLGGDAEKKKETSKMGEQDRKRNEGSLDGLLDGDMIASVGRILSRVSGEKNDKTALLEAMKPYLNQKRRDKMDRAMKLAKMARLAGIAFSEYGGK